MNRSKRAIEFELVDTRDLGVGRLEGKGMRFSPTLPMVLRARESAVIEVLINIAKAHTSWVQPWLLCHNITPKKKSSKRPLGLHLCSSLRTKCFSRHIINRMPVPTRNVGSKTFSIHVSRIACKDAQECYKMVKSLQGSGRLLLFRSFISYKMYLKKTVGSVS